MAAKRCDPEEMKRIAELRNSGMTARKIALLMGLERKTTESRIKLLITQGLVESKARLSHVFTPEEDAKLREMRLQGSSVMRIAKVMRLSIGHIKGRITKMGADWQSCRPVEIAPRPAVRAAAANTDVYPDDGWQWLRNEVRASRKIARKHGWVNRPARPNPPAA